MKSTIVLVALVVFAVGCGNTHGSGGTGSDSGTGPEPDAHVDEGSLDSGHVIDESPPIVDAGTIPDADSGSEEDDSGQPPLDAAVGDDAGEDAGEDPSEDASVAMCTGELATPATFGTADAPVLLVASDAPFEGQIDWRGRAFARITGVTPGERYVITASVASNLILSAFTDDTTFKDAACVSGDQPAEFDRLCLVTATTESIDVAIDALHGPDTFELTIAPAYHSEGTSAAPVQIAASALPYNLQVNSEVRNFYEITGLIAGVSYVVSAQASSDSVIVSAFQGTAFDASTPDVALGYNARALATPQGTSLFVSVRAWGQGTTAVLDVRPASRQAQGTIGAPVQIASSALPFEGEVGWAYNRPSRPSPSPISMSFYAITGLTPGAYVVSVGGVTGPVRVSLYGDDSSYAYADSIGWVTADETVDSHSTTRISGSVLYLRITNLGGDGTPLTIDLEPAPYTAVGTEAAPVDIAAGELPYSSEVEPRVDSFYVITGLTPGQRYLARATDVTALPVGVMLFDDALGPYTGTVCELQVETDALGNTCTVVPTGSSVHVRARAFGHGSAIDTGGVFTLSLEPIVEQSVGTLAAPITIECPAGTYSGRIGTDGYSHYEIVGLEPGAAYLVEALPSDSYVDLIVFSEAGNPYTDPLRCNDTGAPRGFPARCIGTSATGSLFVQVIGYARGQPVEISVRPAVSGSEGTQSAPVALALAELPYAGQVSGARPSFYAISGVEVGTAYVARVAPVEERLDVLLYAGLDGFAGELAGLGPVIPGAPFERVFVPTDTTVYLSYALAIGSDGLSAVEIDLVEAPHQSEGVDVPLPLALDETHAGSVDSARMSRYELTGLTSGERYIATLSNVSAQLSMELYEGDLGVLDSACTYDPTTMSTQQCTFAPEGTAVRLEVRLSNATSATFDLDVSVQQ